MIKIGAWGSFDYIIHEGHIMFLKEAKTLGDHLCIFVVSDDTIIKNKHRLPFYSAKQRAKNLLFTGLVDDSIVLTSSDYISNIENQIIPLNLDRFIFGIDQNNLADKYLKARLDSIGIEIIISTLPEIIHTTDLLHKIGYF